MALSISGLGKRYLRNGQEFWAVKDVNLEIPDGAFVNIIGHSGSGKTTLLNMLAGLLKPTTGEVRIGDRNISEFNDKELSELRNHKIGYIMQGNSVLSNLTVYENVLLPCGLSRRHGDTLFEKKKAEADRLLEMVGISTLKNSYPAELSGGELKRTTIARALINRPEIILADEPTGDLDPENTQEVLKLFRDISESGVTVISVTHEIENIGFADKVYRMSRGELSIIISGEY